MYYIGLDVHKKTISFCVKDAAVCVHQEGRIGSTRRYRGLVLRQAVQMKNRVSGLLMETGVSYNKLRLHRMGYFAELLATNEEISECIRPLLRLCREHINQRSSWTPLCCDRWNRIRCWPTD